MVQPLDRRLMTEATFQSKANEQDAVLDNYGTRVQAIETIGGLAPGDVSDATIASSVAQPGSQTGNALDSAVALYVGTFGRATYDALRSNYAPLRGILRLDGDGATNHIGTIHAALASYDYVSIVPESEGTVVGTSGRLNIPDGKMLHVDPSITIRALANGSNDVEYMVNLGNRSRFLCDGTLDGNLTARDASGETQTFTWGIAMVNVSNAYSTCARFVDMGITGSHNAGIGNGGAVLIGITEGATDDVVGNLHEGGVLEGDNHGFMSRIRSPFTGVGFGEFPHYVQFNEIRRLRGAGGMKNACEVVGPNTRENVVSDCVAIDPIGQGGFECDYGASHNKFQRCKVWFTPGTEIAMTFDGFSNRTADDQGDGKPKPPRGNVWEDCELIGGVMTGNLSLRGFSSVGSGSDATWIRPRMRGQEVGSGTGALVGIYVQGDYGHTTGIKVVDPDIEAVQRLVWALTPSAGTGTLGRIEVEGGRGSYTDSALTVPNNAQVEHASFRRVKLEGTATALRLENVLFADVQDCEFTGQTSDTILPPTKHGSVLRYGGNVFRCATNSGQPVRGPGSGQGYLIDQGGNIYTRRVPGSAVDGADGQVRASGANVVTNALGGNALTGSTVTAHMRPVAYRSNRPSSGTHLAGSEWRQPQPGSGASPGEVCVGVGTYGSYSSTATTTSGSPEVNVGNASGLRVGEWVTISGAVTIALVVAIDGNMVTLSSHATSTTSGAQITHRPPNWRALPAIASA